jgi:hypothetical protein
VESTTRLAAAAVLLLWSCPIASATGNASRGRGASVTLLRALPDRALIDVKGVRGVAAPRPAHGKAEPTLLATPLGVQLLLPIEPRHEAARIVAIGQAPGQRCDVLGGGEPAPLAVQPERAYGLALRVGGSVADLAGRALVDGHSLARALLRSAFAAFAIAAHYTEPDQARTVALAESLFASAEATYDLARGQAVLGVALSELTLAVDYLATSHVDPQP